MRVNLNRKIWISKWVCPGYSGRTCCKSECNSGAGYYTQTISKGRQRTNQIKQRKGEQGRREDGKRLGENKNAGNTQVLCY